jgi:hypothetical protein
MYDIVYIGTNSEDWQKLKSRFPTAKRVDTFARARELVFTKMFWIVWDDLVVRNSFDFSYQPDEWSMDYIHVFKNSDGENGIVLCPKKSTVSQNEINYRFFLNKKDIDIVASDTRLYDSFNITTYDDYLAAFDNTTTSMFWGVPADVTVSDSFDFTFKPLRNDEQYTHCFLNSDEYNGIVLFNTQRKVSRNEFNYHAYLNNKKVDVVASHPCGFDVVFISYNEPNANKNYRNLLKVAPRAKRVHGIKGIHQAHIEAARQATTDMFWVVDGDAEILDGFDFEFKVPRCERDCVHVWRSKNPVNDLTYGYGGVKLLPSELTKCVDVESADMTTSISNKFVAMTEVSNVTAFDTDPFSTWRSAFRECAKLASNVIRGQIDDETNARLDRWCNSSGEASLYGAFARRGACAGREFGLSSESSVQLGKINDYDWLYEKFQEDSSAAS